MRRVNCRPFDRSPILLLSFTIILVAATSGAQISAPIPGGTLASHKVVLPTTDELIKKGPKVAVETVAEVLGMVRGPQRNTRGVNKIEVVASGTIAEQPQMAPGETTRSSGLRRLSTFSSGRPG